MSRQLNLRVSDEFAEKLERVAGRLGRPMSGVLEEVGMAGLDAAEADAKFEEEALAAWEAYQFDGEAVPARSVDRLFARAGTRAKATRSRGR